jgi:hypothetical protein
MIARAMFRLAALVFSAILLTVATTSGQGGEMLCQACHDMHNAVGGTLNTAEEFDLICDSCHGPAAAATAVFADRHVDPTVNEASGNTGKPAWEMGCSTCHTPHRADTVNHLYNNGTQHAHSLGNDSGNLVDGINIKLLGRDEDGTGIAKIATPLRINAVSSTGPCTNSNTEVEVFLPPFVDGDGPPALIGIGDRLIINNAGAEFDGTFRAKETDWDGIQNSPPTGWVCFDRPTTATYEPTGFVRSKGWHTRPLVWQADWAAGTANLSLFGDHSIRVGDTIDVSGVTEVNPGTFNGLKTVTALTNTHVTAASWAAGTATVTLAENHLYQAGELVDVAGVISGGPGSFNGRFTITIVNGLDVSYDLATDPGTYTNNGTIATPQISRVAYAAADPGTTNVSGGEVEFLGSVKTVQSMAVVTPPGAPPFLVQNATWTDIQGGPQVTGEVELTLDRVHPFAVDDVIMVSGIDPAGYNGTFVVDSVGATTLTYLGIDVDPGTYNSGGEIPDPSTPAAALEITLTNSDSNIHQFQSATTGIRDGDIITVFGVDPDGYNGRWEVESVALPVVTVRCPPYFRTSLQAPFCSFSGLPAYVSGGDIQSTGTMRPVVLESRGEENTDPDFLSDYTHSFTNTDEDEDGWMDGPCETCHTQTSNHQNDDFGNTHNNGRTCTEQCHTHSTGFDKDNPFCHPGRTCPPVN